MNRKSLIASLFIYSTLFAGASRAAHFHVNAFDALLPFLPDRHFGEVVATGDFDGNGIDELVVGMPRASVGVEGEEKVNAGQVTVLGVSQSGGFVSQLLLTDQSLGRSSETGDFFGQSLLASDLDGDGFEDLVIGVPFEDQFFLDNLGAAWIVFGSATGLDAATALKIGPSDFSAVEPLSLNMDFGFSLAAWKPFRDDRVELAVGSPGIAEERGKVYSIPMIGRTIDAAGTQVVDQNSTNVSGTPEPDDRFGFSLAVWPCPEGSPPDCIELLAIGVPFEDIASKADAGAVNLVRKQEGSLQGASSSLLHRNLSFVLGQARAEEQFGYALASGRVGCPLRPSLIVGVPGDDTNPTGISTGSVQRIARTPSGGFLADVLLTPEHWVEAQRFGSALAVGNFSDDSCEDVAIAAPAGFPNLAGSTVILHSQGFPDFNSTTEASVIRGVGIDTHPGLIASDAFGSSLAVGNFGRGRPDLVIGAPDYDFSGTDSGGVFVMRNQQRIFADGFESEGTGAWTSAIP